MLTLHFEKELRAFPNSAVALKKRQGNACCCKDTKKKMDSKDIYDLLTIAAACLTQGRADF
jgi:hypothetical protein